MRLPKPSAKGSDTACCCYRSPEQSQDSAGLVIAFQFLQVADPEDACSELRNDPPEDDWVALIIRSHHDSGEMEDDCTFDRKVSCRRAPGLDTTVLETCGCMMVNMHGTMFLLTCISSWISFISLDRYPRVHVFQLHIFKIQ
jgi:hypothetical protein